MRTWRLRVGWLLRGHMASPCQKHQWVPSPSMEIFCLHQVDCMHVDTHLTTEIPRAACGVFWVSWQASTDSKEENIKATDIGNCPWMWTTSSKERQLNVEMGALAWVSEDPGLKPSSAARPLASRLIPLNLFKCALSWGACNVLEMDLAHQPLSQWWSPQQYRWGPVVWGCREDWGQRGLEVAKNWFP